ncbi:MAG: DUF6125 family protein [Candidatus Helarchaeota archaeon]
MKNKLDKINDIKIPDLDDLNNLYSILGQVLDGVWFLETEKRIGFDKALEIDLAVWDFYAINETKRILSILLENPDNRFNFPYEKIFNILEHILKISLFNQSIDYEIVRNDKDKTLIFKVTNCKTLKGMRKVGRPLLQAQKICKDIGLAYYKNMVKTLHPDLKIECISIPESYNLVDNSVLCSWKFYFE